MALREKPQFHESAVAGLQREHRRLQDRIDAMDMDKLDERIDNEFFDRKAGEFRAEQNRIMRDVQGRQPANRSYIEDGIELPEPAHNAHRLFESQPPAEKRQLLDFVLSNCQWKEGSLTAEYRQPFNLIAAAAIADHACASIGAGNGDFDNWR